jgi:hypothetical protein
MGILVVGLVWVAIVDLAIAGAGLRQAAGTDLAGFDPISLVGLAGAPVVLALVQMVKVTWPFVPTRYFPLASLGFAVALNLGVAAIIGSSLPIAVLVGLVTGLSASGFYSWGGALRG